MLVVTAVLCVAVPIAARAHPGPWTRIAARVLAAVLLVWYAAYHLIVALQGSYALDFDLPLHLTDAVTIIAALALWHPRMLLFELTYFWGLTASLQAVLTRTSGRTTASQASFTGITSSPTPESFWRPSFSPSGWD